MSTDALAHAGAPAGPSEVSAAAGSAASDVPLNILVVDDEAPIRKLLRMGLATRGYQFL